jgi:purine catabolism regulator
MSATGAELAQFSKSHALDANFFEQLRERGAIRAMESSKRAVRWRPRPSRLSTALPSGAGYAIRIRNEVVGFVLVVDGGVPATELDLRAVEQAGTVAALQISHQRALAVQESRMGYALVASLVEGTFDEKPSNMERAALMGWERSKRYRLATVLLDEPNPLTREGFARRENLASEIRAALTQLSEPVLMSLSANQIFVLLPEKVRVEDLWANIAHGRSALGISELHKGVSGMRAAGKEVADIMEHLLPGRIQSFDEILFPRVLAGEASARSLFLSRLFDGLDDERKGTQLLDTAVALAEEGFHLQHTADRLKVHISTLRGRLSRLTEMTGLDLESVEGRFRLQVGARLLLMSER